MIWRRLILTLAAVSLVGCGARVTHQPSSQAELADEARIVIAAARSRLERGEERVCVARRIEIVRSLHALPTTELAEVAKLLRHMPPPDPSATVRQLGASDLAGQGVARPDAACTGVRFIGFGRVQFLGDAAVVNAGEQRSDTCSVGPVLFRFQRREGEWRLVETVPLSAMRPNSCTPETPTKADYFSIDR